MVAQLEEFAVSVDESDDLSSSVRVLVRGHRPSHEDRGRDLMAPVSS